MANPNAILVRSSAELLPWLALLTEGVVLNKDGSLMVAFSVNGMDPESVSPASESSAVKAIEAALAPFGESVTVWHITDKVPTNGTISASRIPTESSSNKLAQYIEDSFHARLNEPGVMFTRRATIWIVYNGGAGIAGLMNRFEHHSDTGGLGLPTAFVQAALDVLSPMRALNTMHADRNVSVQEIEAMALQASSALGTLGVSRLFGPDLTEALFYLTNPTSRACPYIPRDVALDQFLGNGDTTVGGSTLRLDHSENHTFVSAIGLNRWCEASAGKTSPTLFLKLSSLNTPMRVVHCIRFFNDLGKSRIDDMANYFKLASVPFMKALMAGSAQGTVERDKGEMSLREVALEAKRISTLDNAPFVLYSASVLLFGPTEQAVTIARSQMVERMSAKDLLPIAERKNLLGAWKASMPGGGRSAMRYNLFSLANAADCIATYSIPQGSPHNEHWAERLKQPVGPLLVTRSRMSTQTSWLGTDGGIGHLLALASTNSGKTTTMLLLMHMAKLRWNARVVIFDANHSCRIPTILGAQRHVDLGAGAVFRLNPFIALRDGEDGFLHLTRWLRGIGWTQSGNTISDDEKAALTEALRLAQEDVASGRAISFSSFVVMLPNRELRGRFTDYHGDGVFAPIFDHEVDDFEACDWVTFEAAKYFADPVLGPAWVDHMLYSIYRSLDGKRPIIIYLEEMWRLLKLPYFVDVLENWLRTIRKLLGNIWGATQSCSEISGDHLQAIREQFKQFVFCGNTELRENKSLAGVYQKTFGLTDTQLVMLSSVQPKREIMVVSQSYSRVLDVQMTPQCVAPLRSELDLQKLFDEHQSLGLATWRNDYLKAVHNRS